VLHPETTTRLRISFLSKAELLASFQDAVNAAVEKRLAQVSAAVAAQPASQSMPS